MQTPGTPPATEPTPDAMTQTSAAFASSCRSRFGRSEEASLEVYRRWHRTGQWRPERCAPPEPPAVPGVARVLRSPSPEGEVIKFLTALPRDPRDPSSPGELHAESVLIPMIGRSGVPTYTLCVSSQIGCAMGCVFCETAQMGLVRSLTPGEIVAQWWNARHAVGIAPKNLVFMGMGEPMDNLDAVLGAIGVLTDHNGPGVAMNKITISTVGRVEGIARLASKIREPGWHRLNLAVSLNAPDDAIRSSLMPINRAHNLAALREAIRGWPKFGGGKVCLEYVLIPGVNDAPEHAERVAEFARGLPVCVNVIPYNPRRDSPWPAPDERDVARFLEWLGAAGAYAKRRRTKGRDMMGACGQLGSEEIRRRRLVRPSVSAPSAPAPAAPTA